MKVPHIVICGLGAVALVLALASCSQPTNSDPAPAPAPVTLTSITAAYDDSHNTIFPDTTLHTLKEDLTVTAHYSDGTSKKLVTEEYDLVGPLAAGSCTITVKYQSKETTFTVMVGTLHEHVWGAWEQIKAPTCMAVGEKQRQCTADPPHPETDDGDPIDTVNGHNWGTVTVTTPATCMATGVGRRICSINTAHIDAQAVIPINSSAHDYQWEVTTPASESENGVETQICQRARDDSTHHGSTRRLDAIGTNGLAYELINDGTAYRVRKGTVTGGVVYIPATYNGLPVTQIGSSADNNSSSGAFYGITITAVYIPETVTSIGAYAFYGRSQLTAVNFAANSQLTTIGNEAFRDCSSLGNVTIPEGVTSIGSTAFMNCRFTSITIPASVTSIGSNAFYGNTGLTTVTFASGSQLTAIGGFNGLTNLTSIDIPASVTYIGNYAFDGCTGLTEITIPANVTAIGEGAFYGCTSLTSITIPAGVTTVGQRAFLGWTSSQTINVPFADAAAKPSGWHYYWAQGCNATINYQ